MPNEALEPSLEVMAVRAKLMDDLEPVGVIAKAFGKSPRTILRMIAARKLPIVRIGRTPYVVVSRARELLIEAPTIRHAPVRRGRPAGRKAA